MNPKVDEYLSKAQQWQPELKVLRQIMLDCGLTEEYKWRVPCYTYGDRNILLLNTFKDYCALAFFKGVLLSDLENLLVSPGENSQSVKFFKFTGVSEVIALINTIKSYVFEAIELEKSGAKIQLKKPGDHDMPPELEKKLGEDNDFKKAFYALTPGRQRAYIIHFTGAKQSATRSARIENMKPRILKGFGFNDCTCGLSKKYPVCDGSHKILDPSARLI